MKNRPMLFIGILLIIALCLVVFYQRITDPFREMRQAQQIQSHTHEQENFSEMSFTEEMKTYGQLCAHCHGKLGEGTQVYPSLQNSQLTLDEIKDIIVNGKGNMEGISIIKEPMLTKLAKFVKKL
jgi:menaquinol-cytochrome c reductase cytochrome b/c subunit